MLDNCEHVLDDAAELVERLERTCSRVQVLATSREGLGIDGERILAVPSLGTPERRSARRHRGGRCRAPVRGSGARVRRRLEITAENAEGSDRCVGDSMGCRSAIEMAAARLPAMMPVNSRLGWTGASGAGGRAPGQDPTPPDVPGSDRLVVRPAESPSSGVGAGDGVSGAGPSTRPGPSVPEIRSTPTTCSSSPRVSWAGRWWSPKTAGSRPVTGCWRRSESTARNGSPNTARPTGTGEASGVLLRARPESDDRTWRPPADRSRSPLRPRARKPPDHDQPHDRHRRR